uniref:Uncharacterized protein n=1 Tax=Rhizophora mucronata TaxID=61149 RepID=A0A2P2PZC2_RHIMU
MMERLWLSKGLKQLIKANCSNLSMK